MTFFKLLVERLKTKRMILVAIPPDVRQGAMDQRHAREQPPSAGLLGSAGLMGTNCIRVAAGVINLAAVVDQASDRELTPIETDEVSRSVAQIRGTTLHHQMASGSKVLFLLERRRGSTRLPGDHMDTGHCPVWSWAQTEHYRTSCDQDYLALKLAGRLCSPQHWLRGAQRSVATHRAESEGDIRLLDPSLCF